MDDQQVDYKELYFKLFRATEAAIRILIAAQQECEALYLNADHTPGITKPKDGSPE